MVYVSFCGYLGVKSFRHSLPPSLYGDQHRSDTHDAQGFAKVKAIKQEPPVDERRTAGSGELHERRDGNPSIIWADSGYAGKLEDWVKKTLDWTLEIVKRPFEGMRYVWMPQGVEPPEMPRGFVMVKRRWAVERTFGWLESEESWIYTAMIRIMLARLA